MSSDIKIKVIIDILIFFSYFEILSENFDFSGNFNLGFQQDPDPTFSKTGSGSDQNHPDPEPWFKSIEA